MMCHDLGYNGYKFVCFKVILPHASMEHPRTGFERTIAVVGPALFSISVFWGVLGKVEVLWAIVLGVRALGPRAVSKSS